MSTKQNEAQHTPPPGQWEILYDDHAKEYYLSEVGGFAVPMHPLRLSDLERIVHAVKCWDALVEALDRSLDVMRAIVDQRAIAEQSRHLTEQARIDIRLELFDAISDAQLALAAVKKDNPKSEGNK